RLGPLCSTQARSSSSSPSSFVGTRSPSAAAIMWGRLPRTPSALQAPTTASLYLDVSGSPRRRGAGEVLLLEDSLAAAVLRNSGWDRAPGRFDMRRGTITIGAALWARGIAPGSRATSSASSAGLATTRRGCVRGSEAPAGGGAA